MSNIIYKLNADVSADSLHALYTAIGWNDDGLRTLAVCERILHHSWCYVSAHDGDRLIGFARVLADGFVGEILDVIVLPAYRRRGVGSQLMRKLLDAATELTLLHLVDGSACPKFYGRFGFEAAEANREIIMYRRQVPQRP